MTSATAATTLLQPAPTRSRMLFVASTGGHLAQLVRLAPAFTPADDSVWLTFRSPQSESLLEGRTVEYVPYVAPRDFGGVLHTAATTVRMLREQHFDLVVSTGAAVALGVLPLARLLRIPTLYIESVSRVRGPSLTGRIISGLHLAGELRTQHSSWSGGRWRVQQSVLHEFRTIPKRRTGNGPLKVFVTLGTIHPYRFDSLIDALLRTGLMNEDTVWQLGDTDRTDLPGTVTAQMPSAEFDRRVREADVVVTHAGVGTVLGLLEAGVHPVVVPRRSSRDEHVDDHQTQITELLASAGVATVAEAPELTADHLKLASRLAIAPKDPA